MSIPLASRLYASCTLVFCVALLMYSNGARADIPRPPKPAPNASANEAPSTQPTAAGHELRASLLVRRDRAATEAHLRIPQAALDALRQQGGGEKPRASAGPTPAQTAVAGVAMSAALVLGGLQLVRRRRALRPIAPLLVLLWCGGAAALVWANSPPRDLPSFRNDVLPIGHADPVPNAGPTGTVIPVVIEVTRDGAVQLTLPESKLGLFANAPATLPSNPGR